MLKKNKPQSGPVLFGRFHDEDKIRNLFMCSCGASVWVEELKETVREVKCNKCGLSFLLLKKSHGYNIVLQKKRV
jgi:DNA-directed RNA polymerase subunit RPC12/RpoP